MRTTCSTDSANTRLRRPSWDVLLRLPEGAAVAAEGLGGLWCGVAMVADAVGGRMEQQPVPVQPC